MSPADSRLSSGLGKQCLQLRSRRRVIGDEKRLATNGVYFRGEPLAQIALRAEIADFFRHRPQMHAILPPLFSRLSHSCEKRVTICHRDPPLPPITKPLGRRGREVAGLRPAAELAGKLANPRRAALEVAD